MIGGLRRKFILVAMLSTIVVLAAIMGTVNVSNYLRLTARADSMTEMLADNNGQFERTEPSPEGNLKTPPGMDSPETPFRTRFFTITLDQGGEISSYGLEHIAAVDEEDAKEYLERALEEGSDTGFLGAYRFRKASLSTQGDEEGTEVWVFLDCREDLANFRNILISTLSMSGLGLAAVLVLVVIFSRLVFRPVEESLQKQKRFITDASHELKTPLTIIDANTEVIEMESGESQWTKSTRKQVARLTSLVQQMVTLTRLDESREQPEKGRFSLSEAVEDTVRPYEAPAKAGGKQMKMEIENDAGEIPKGNLDILFERFYRLDTSRSSGTGGSGIGLSIAKSIVQSHRGKIHARSDDGKRLTVTVVL